jgi:prepilin-type N-terminal cleavage/methylation domain-containing protein
MKNDILKIKNNKLKIGDFRKGMTYVELIVVLSIFSVMSSVVIFNYSAFQTKVDIKNLANDVALKVVEAQKSSLFGKFPKFELQGELTTSWKPSYGLYFNVATEDNKKNFMYFVDLDQNKAIRNPTCASYNDECLEKIVITKGNSISSLDIFYEEGNNSTKVSLPTDMVVTFTRPSSSASIQSVTTFNPNFLYAQITITSLSSTTSRIKIYRSGRIQLN